MNKFIAIAILLATLSPLAAQEKDQVFIVKELPKGKTIRLAVEDSTGKIVDGGQFISMAEYQKLVAVSAKMERTADKQIREWLAFLYPDIYKAMTDTSYTVVKRSLIPTPPAPKKKK